MDDWEKFNKISLSKEEDFYSLLNMEDIIDADYAHAKRVCKDFKIRNLEDYHDLYVESDTLLLADVFENFRNMCTKICELDTDHILSAPGLAWQAPSTRTAICQYVEAKKKYMKNFDKIKESLYLKYWNVNNLHRWQCRKS